MKQFELIMDKIYNREILMNDEISICFEMLKQFEEMGKHGTCLKIFAEIASSKKIMEKFYQHDAAIRHIRKTVVKISNEINYIVYRCPKDQLGDTVEGSMHLWNFSVPRHWNEIKRIPFRYSPKKTLTHFFKAVGAKMVNNNRHFQYSEARQSYYIVLLPQ